MARLRAPSPLTVLDAVAKAPDRVRRIKRGRRGFLRRGWLVLRDTTLRPALGL